MPKIGHDKGLNRLAMLADYHCMQSGVLTTDMEVTSGKAG